MAASASAPPDETTGPRAPFRAQRFHPSSVDVKPEPDAIPVATKPPEIIPPLSASRLSRMPAPRYPAFIAASPTGGPSTEALQPPENPMPNDSTLSLPDLEDRIAILRDNIRQLTEQAAAASGAASEARNADRIAEQEEELKQLVAQRDEMLKKRT
jgi:uncharacterized small protein (DUF1192 family)